MRDYPIIDDSEYNLWVLLQYTRDAIVRARQKDLKKYNISTRQGTVLLFVKATGEKATPADIARWLLREPHSISNLVSRMERDGLVRKVKDLRRKNMVRIELTDKGHKAYSQTTERRSIHEIMAALSEEEREQLRTSLHKLLAKAFAILGPEHEAGLPFLDADQE